MAKQTKRNPVQLPLFEASSLVKFDPHLNPDAVPVIMRHLDLSSKQMIRTAVFHPDTIFAHLKERARPSSDVQVWQLDGIEFTVTPKRLFAFLERIQCVRCSAEGMAFYVEKHVNETQPVYLNLYGINKHGALTLLTCDHILPDSYGGRYHVDNFQTMCTHCNGDKANRMSNSEIKRVLGNLPRYAKEWLDKDFMKSLLELHLEMNKERDQKCASKLRAVFNRHLKNVSHATKATQYEKMTKDIVQVLKQHEMHKRIEGIKRWFKSFIPRTLGRFFYAVDKKSI